MRQAVKAAVFLIPAALFFSAAFAAPRVPALKPPQEILVEFKKELAPDDIAVFKAKHGTEPASAERAAALLANIYGMTRARHQPENVPFTCYKIGDPSKINDIINALKNESIVLNAQPNYFRYALYTPQTQPNDPIYRKTQPFILPVDQWGISLPNQWGFAMINADTAYNSGHINQLPTRQVIVAVIDTGMKTDHPDLAGMTITGRHIITPTAEPLDDELGGGHGTHSAGVIGAQAGNGIGIAGAAYTNTTWTARVLLMPVKVLDFNGDGNDSDAAAGIIWAADHGANVINLSFGGPEQSDVLRNAINYAFIKKACVVVAAAGNSGAQVWYPAAYPNVISVAATDPSDKRVSFSNYGKIDVSAPGVDIWSCTNWDTFSTTLPAYYSEDGTSFAAPFVSGLAAMIILKYGTIGPEQVRSIIERSADDIETPGYDIYSGWGRINMARALSQDFNAPQKATTYNWPNPFSPGLDLYTNIVFQLASPADAGITIYDAGGDVVWKKDLAAAQTMAGDNSVKWDGRNMAGTTAATGTYFYVLKTASGNGKNKITVIH